LAVIIEFVGEKRLERAGGRYPESRSASVRSFGAIEPGTDFNGEFK
jgi:hypothetical protein